MFAIELKELSIGYLSGRKPPVAVATGLTAAVRPGQLTCLLGPNGVGKSTLLRTLSAFQRPLAGQVLVGGRDVHALSQDEVARTVSVVLTERPRVDNMTVAGLVAMGRMPYTGFWGTLKTADSQAVDEALRLMGIGWMAGRSLRTLSDGELQKALIAKALAQATPVVMLDEPTAFLDFPSKAETLLTLRQLAHETGRTIFLSTHDVEMALQVADEVWLMDRGQPLQTGTPRALADTGALSSFVCGRGVTFDVETLKISLREV